MKAVLDSLDDVPEPIRDEYEERDGKYVLKLDDEPPGFVPADKVEELKSTVGEFRSTNIGLKQKVDELEGQLNAYDGIDPAEHAKLQEQLDEMKAKAPKKDQQFQQLQSQLDQLSSKLEETSEREKQARRDLAEKEMESTLREIGAKAGVEEVAMPDYLARAKSVFGVGEDGGITTEKYSADNPGKPLTPQEYVRGLQSEAPHLFSGSAGGGADPKPGRKSGVKTFDPEDPQAWVDHAEEIAKGEMVRQQ